MLEDDVVSLMSTLREREGGDGRVNGKAGSMKANKVVVKEIFKRREWDEDRR